MSLKATEPGSHCKLRASTVLVICTAFLEFPVMSALWFVWWLASVNVLFQNEQRAMSKLVVGRQSRAVCDVARKT